MLPFKSYVLNEDIDDKIPGGLADNFTPEDIAKKHNVTLEHIQKQIDMGIKIEREHTNDDSIAREISLDHLVEDPDYYTKLATLNL